MGSHGLVHGTHSRVHIIPAVLLESLAREASTVSIVDIASKSFYKWILWVKYVAINNTVTWTVYSPTLKKKKLHVGHWSSSSASVKRHFSLVWLCASHLNTVGNTVTLNERAVKQGHLLPTFDLGASDVKPTRLLHWAHTPTRNQRPHHDQQWLPKEIVGREVVRIMMVRL